MENANKRIAKNTVYMYVRLVTTMVIGLYISRLALEVLGVSDFGLFSVVGGVLAIFTFISSSLSSATTRFFNIEMGKPDGDVNASFNINLVLHTAMAAVVLVLSESIGMWYIHNHLNVAPDRMGDAVFIFHVSMLTACIGIVNTPYQSLITAHERFRFLTVLDITNSVIRLCGILLLSIAPREGISATVGGCHLEISLLRLYSIIFALTTANSFAAAHWLAWREWRDIIKIRFVGEWKRYKAVLVYNNWNLLATLTYMTNNSGTDLLLNAFFGTAMNGAFAISRTVKQAIANFTGNFDSASAPQIIQAYAAGDSKRYTYLCNQIGRINILAFELIGFPLLVELDFVLKIWLGKVPDGAYTLTFLSIIQGGLALTCGGIYNLINATGKIKWFKINTSFFFLIAIPIGYALFSIGYPPYSILIVLILAEILQRVVQLLLMHRLLGFDSWQYAREAYGKPALIGLIASAGLYAHSLMTDESAAKSIGAIAVCTVLTVILIYTIGLKREERMTVKHFIASRL